MKRFTVLAVTLLITSQGALAAEAPFYLGLRVGSAMENRLPQEPGNPDSETPFSGYVGYHFTDFFALEVSYTDLGNSTRSAIVDAGFDLDGSLWTIGATGNLPINEHFSAFGGGGFFDLNEDGTAISLGGPRQLNADDRGFYVEAGGRYRFTEQFAARLSYQWFDFDRDGDGTPWFGLEVGF